MKYIPSYGCRWPTKSMACVEFVWDGPCGLPNTQTIYNYQPLYQPERKWFNWTPQKCTNRTRDGIGMALVFYIICILVLTSSYSSYRIRGSAELNDFPKKAQPGCSMSSVLNSPWSKRQCLSSESNHVCIYTCVCIIVYLYLKYVY